MKNKTYAHNTQLMRESQFSSSELFHKMDHSLHYTKGKKKGNKKKRKNKYNIMAKRKTITRFSGYQFKKNSKETLHSQ